MGNLTDHVVFNDEKLAKKYRSGPIPMSVLYEAYFEGDVDLVGDIFDLLRNRESFLKYTITRQHLQWAVTSFVPDLVAHTRGQDEKLAREMYDRGDDFFEAFLGPAMVYTTGIYANPESSLEEAHSHTTDIVAQKLQLKPGERLLDIGCGWGTLLADCSARYQVESTGITLAQRQADYGNRIIQERGLGQHAKVLCQDYRDLDSKNRFDKIVCFEMIQQVGYKNLSAFCERALDVLEDDGLLLLQWTGLRRGLRPEDLIWGLFMNKYIFPGADAALPPSSMIKTFEKAGFELYSAENVSGHYAHTLLQWHRNWQRNKAAVVANYGDKLFRIWNFFLAWSTVVAEQGSAGCYQLVLNKNLDHFNRRRWLTSSSSAAVNTSRNAAGVASQQGGTSSGKTSSSPIPLHPKRANAGATASVSPSKKA